MADGIRPTAAITVGGKGSSLSSASIFSIAYKLAQVRIDSSALDKLSSATHPPKDLHEYRISFPDFLTTEELRASLAVTLSKLLLSANTTRIRPDLPIFISQTLNSGLLQSNPCTLEPVHVTKEEREVLDYCLSTLDGICAVVDYGSSALCAVADVVAALSCEASKANISVFNSLDSGDGFSLKDEVAVASDLKVLLNGSKFVGKVEVGAVTDIPRIHGSLREATRAVHSRARVELNSGLKGGFTGANKAWEISLSSLVSALRNLGHSSLSRLELNLDSIADDWLKSNLMVFFKESCPTDDSLRDASKLVLEAAMGQQYGEFLHLVNKLLISVRKILSSEMSIAIMLLEGSEWLGSILNGTTPEADLSGGRDNSDKKADKKKKKAVLGKGTTVFVQLVKDKVQSTSASADAVDKLILLKTCAERIISILDPRDEDFDSLAQKIKEIVESNETRRLPKLPKGTRDFAKEQMAVRERAFSIIAEVFKRHGAMALDTPAFEMRETLLGKYGEDSKLIYDLADQGGELCSLRYDLTVPFARYVAMNGLTSFKRYQIAKVYRRDNPSKGRYREFYQCDFDIAGQYEKMGPDFEVVKILTELLDELNIGVYEIKLNHRKLLDGMLDICGVPSDKFRTICSSIDKLDKLPFEQVKKEMVEEKGLTVEVADKIGTFVKKHGHPLELLAELKQEGSQFLGHEGSKVALDELEIMFKALEKSKCITKVVFDLSLARGLDYYTGVIFEAVFKGTTQVGSIAAGGRYDNLIGMFGTKQVPAVGASLGIERVFAIMEQIQKDQNQVIRACETEVLVSVLFDDLSLAAEVVSELWSAKIKAEYMVTKRVMKHIDRAKEFRIPYVVFVGERELGEGIVKIKDIENAKEETVPRNAVVEELKKRLSGTLR